MHAIDKAAKHLGFDSIKEDASTEYPLCFGPNFLCVFGVSVIFNPHAIQITVYS